MFDILTFPLFFLFMSIYFNKNNIKNIKRCVFVCEGVFFISFGDNVLSLVIFRLIYLFFGFIKSFRV